MKSKLSSNIALFILLLFCIVMTCSCDVVSTDTDIIEYDGTVMYMEITNNHHVFTAFESSLRIVSIPVNQLPITPNYRELFHVKLSCNKYTSLCDVISINSISNRYP